MTKLSIRLTREAVANARNLDAVKRSALAALKATGSGEVYFVPFTVNGQQFALCSRRIIEVDWLPNRVPQRVIRRQDLKRK